MHITAKHKFSLNFCAVTLFSEFIMQYCNEIEDAAAEMRLCTLTNLIE